MAEEEQQLTTDASVIGSATTDLDTPLPKGLDGTMDGERPPMSKMEEIKKIFSGVQEKYGHYVSHMKPWREFFTLSKPNNDLQARLRANVVYFQINYMMITAATIVVYIITDVRSVMCIAVMSLIWMAFLKKNEDPNWEVNIGGMPLGKSQRQVVLGCISVIALICASAERVFAALFTAIILVCAHGVLHVIPENAEVAAVASV
mmetsp:Transcript_45758/g.106246  ORF Transcript_45758/g.106246 Transcript_45758/m.106246 type:complete len:204 (+) Transcript_45758:66-677(+)